MKKAIHLLLLFPSICWGQIDWAPVGARWWYGKTQWSPVSPSYIVGYYNMVSEEEVIIQGRTCKKLSWENEDQYCVTCDEQLRPYYIYSDSGRVYYYNHDLESFMLLYDMNRTIGESWYTVYPSSDFVLDSMQMTVTDTMSIWVNGTRLRQQRVSYYFQYEFGDIVTEGFGGLKSFFPNCAVGGGCELTYDSLRCYQDSVLGTYQITAKECEYHYTYIGVEEHRQDVLVDVWPNPASEVVNVHWHTAHPSTPLRVTFTDMLGRSYSPPAQEVQGVVGPYMQYDVSTFEKGLYLLSIIQGEMKTTLKVVVQH